MKIAVTGASGFVGRAVLKEFSNRGLRVVGAAIDRLEVISALGHIPVLLDVLEPSAVAYEQLGRPEVLLHLAWGGLPAYRSLHHFEVELPGHYRFLRQMIESGLQTLLVAGTCLEYGMQSGGLSEDLPTRPVTPYGYAKDALRRQLEFLKAEKPFSLIWARLFYLYGAHQSPLSLFSQLQQAVLSGQRVFNMSGGEQLRDYLPVEEAAKILVTLACSRRDVGCVNVCSGKPISVRSLVEKWCADYGWDLRLNLGHYPYLDYEPMAFWGDRSKLDRLLSSL